MVYFHSLLKPTKPWRRKNLKYQFDAVYRALNLNVLIYIQNFRDLCTETVCTSEVISSRWPACSHLTPGAAEANIGVSELGAELGLEVFVAEVALALQSQDAKIMKKNRWEYRHFRPPSLNPSHAPAEPRPCCLKFCMMEHVSASPLSPRGNISRRNGGKLATTVIESGRENQRIRKKKEKRGQRGNES